MSRWKENKTILLYMLKVSWDVSIQGCHWQPLSIHQSRYMYLLRVVTGQFKYQPLFCLEAEIVRLWFLMTFAGQEFFKHQKCQKKWELTHIKSKKRKKKKKLYSSTYVVTTKVSVYNILGIICDTVQHDFFNISSRKRDSHFYVFIQVTHKSSPLQYLLPQLFWDPKYWYGREDRTSTASRSCSQALYRLS